MFSFVKPIIALPAILLAGCSMQQSPKDCQFSAPSAQTVQNVTVCGVEGNPERGGNTVTPTTNPNVSLVPK